MPHPSDPQEPDQQSTDLLVRGIYAMDSDNPREMLECALVSLDLGNTTDAAIYIRKAMTMLEQ